MHETKGQNDTNVDCEASDEEAVSDIKILCAGITIFLLGFFIHVKIISTCKKEQGTSWQLDITHSVVLCFTYFISTTFRVIFRYLPSLHRYIRNGICYTNSFILTFGCYSIFSHSFIVSFLKYTFIVHHRKVFGEEEKVKRAFFWINILHLLFLTILTLCLLDIENMLLVIKCIGLEEKKRAEYNTPFGHVEMVFLCKLNNKPGEELNGGPFYILKQTVCVIKTIWTFIFMCNIPEAFFYFRIFRFIRRYIKIVKVYIKSNTLFIIMNCF